MSDFERIKRACKITEFLERRGVRPAHQAGKFNYYWRTFLDGQRHERYNFSVDTQTNLFFDHKEDIMGGTIIDLYLLMEGKYITRTKADERAALVALASEFGIELTPYRGTSFPSRPAAPATPVAPLAPIVPRPAVAPIVEAANSQEEETPVTEEPKIVINTRVSLLSKYAHNATKRYIENRGIPIDIAAKYCVDISYHYANDRTGKIYHGMGFRNQSKGYVVRNGLGLRLSKFNIGHNDITVVPIANTGNYFVFEGVFDFLSILELNRQTGTENDFDVIVLNTVTNWKKTWPILDNANGIALMLDTDKAGDSTTAKLLERYPNAIDNRQPLREYGVEDWNDLLKKIKGVI